MWYHEVLTPPRSRRPKADPFDRSDQLASHRRRRPCLLQLATSVGRYSLSQGGCRKAGRREGKGAKLSCTRFRRHQLKLIQPSVLNTGDSRDAHSDHIRSRGGHRGDVPRNRGDTRGRCGHSRADRKPAQQSLPSKSGNVPREPLALRKRFLPKVKLRLERPLRPVQT
jgi:hypothetical protein